MRMSLFACLLALGILTWLFDAYLERRNHPNRHVVKMGPGELSPVVLKRNRAGQYMVPVLINGRQLAGLVDTGANSMALSARLAERLGLAFGPRMLAETAGGTVEGFSTALDSVQVGNIRIRDIRAVVMPGMSDDFVLIGMNFLRHVDWEKRGDTLVLQLEGRGAGPELPVP